MNPVGPAPLRASKAKVYDFAEHVARHLGLQPGATLEPVVYLLGGKLTPVSPFEENGLAPPSIEVRSARDFTIFLPTTTSPQRERFTIAHELGHFFLHYPQAAKAKPDAVMVATRWVDPENPEQQRCEWEANWFAAAFLMGREAFTQRWHALGGDAPSIAAEFGVSEQAASIRAKGLALSV